MKSGYIWLTMWPFRLQCDSVVWC